MGRTHYRQLPLAPLDEEAGAALISELLGSHRSLVELSGLIRERAAGNPFFCEQIVSSLAERGVLEGRPGVFRLAHPGIEIEVPATVQAVLSARIDRLADREKLVLQNAAVVGREFPRRLLGEVVAMPEAELDFALRELTDAELVFEAELYPESQYAFRHPLMREVAYGLQLSPARVRTHAAIARALQELDPDRLDEHAALIAQHSEAAGEPLEAARWHARAAVWAGFSDPRCCAEPLAAGARARSRAARERRGRRAPLDLPSDADRHRMAARRRGR